MFHPKYYILRSRFLDEATYLQIYTKEVAFNVLFIH